MEIVESVEALQDIEALNELEALQVLENVEDIGKALHDEAKAEEDKVQPLE